MEQRIHDYDYLFKIIIVGDSNTGKTSLLRRYVDDEFNDSMLTTIGIDFKIKTVDVENRGIQQQVKLQIWDTAGQERFNTITKSYAHGSHAVMLVFGYDDYSSLMHIDKWYDDTYSVLQNTHPEPYFLLVGNKCELKNKAIASTQLESFLQQKQHEFVHIDTSAKSGQNVNETFEIVAKECIARFSETFEQQRFQQNKESFQLTEFPDPTDVPAQSKKCC